MIVERRYNTEYMREYRKQPLQLLRKEVHRLFMIAKRKERYYKVLIDKELKLINGSLKSCRQRYSSLPDGPSITIQSVNA